MERVLIGIAVVTSLSPAGLFGQSGPSKTPSCAKACDLIDCVKNTIRQKRQIIQVYEALATKWMKIWMNADVNPKTPLYVVARTSLDVDTRIHLLEQLKYLNEQADEEIDKIGAPEGCGYEPGKPLSLSTHPFDCTTPPQELVNYEKAAPCRELFEIAKQHEFTVHHVACEKRKQDDTYITPAGLAIEEIHGYAYEINELEKLLKKMEQHCLKARVRVRANLHMAQGPVVLNYDWNTQQPTDVPLQYAEADGDDSFTGSGIVNQIVQGTVTSPAVNCTVQGSFQFPMQVRGALTDDRIQMTLSSSNGDYHSNSVCKTVLPPRTASGSASGVSPQPNFTVAFDLKAEAGQSQTVHLTTIPPPWTGIASVELVPVESTKLTAVAVH